ncbi:MAG TPA: AIR synthase related protein [Actinomycetota bacterium]|jgi:selenophosphate synthetase-related protein|nr:AIR synthase related protein [Actinomycetota bacterium]
MNDSLGEVAAAFRASAALRGKASIGLVSEVFGAADWLHGPGDDAAVVECGDERILVAGEAIWPPFVEADPFGAGIACVVANVNDVAAMGGRALALVDQVVATEEVARRVLEGIRFAAEIYGLPVVGGHLTIWGGTPSVSASIVGRVARALSATEVAAGQECLAAFCLQGTLREDFPFLSSITDRGADLAGDVAVPAELADAGLVAAAKDVSMAGTLGSLAMLLEPTRSGAVVDLDQIPMPDGAELARWVSVFPTYGFLLTAAAGKVAAVRAAFHDRGLACERIGTIDRSGLLKVRLDGEEEVLMDLNTQSVTGLKGPVRAGRVESPSSDGGAL